METGFISGRVVKNGVFQEMTLRQATSYRQILENIVLL